MNTLLPLFAQFSFSSFPTPGAPPSEMEEFKAKACEIARAKRTPLMQCIRSALLHLLPAGLSAIVTARRNERQLRREIKRLEELSSHLLSDIGYRRTYLGDYVLDKTINGKRPVADTSPVSSHSCPDDAQLAAQKAA